MIVLCAGRLLPSPKRKRPCCASRTFSRCRRANTARSITSIDSSETDTDNCCAVLFVRSPGSDGCRSLVSLSRKAVTWHFPSERGEQIATFRRRHSGGLDRSRKLRIARRFRPHSELLYGCFVVHAVSEAEINRLRTESRRFVKRFVGYSSLVCYVSVYGRSLVKLANDRQSINYLRILSLTRYIFGEGVTFVDCIAANVLSC